MLPAADEEFVEFDIECWSSIFPNLWWAAINSCSFSTLEWMVLVVLPDIPVGKGNHIFYSLSQVKIQ